VTLLKLLVEPLRRHARQPLKRHIEQHRSSIKKLDSRFNILRTLRTIIDWLREEVMVSRAMTRASKGKAEITKTSAGRRSVQLLRPAMSPNFLPGATVKNDSKMTTSRLKATYYKVQPGFPPRPTNS